MPPRETASPSTTNEKTPKNKPKASKLRQQKLPAWQPILTASTVIPSVVAVGVIFIPIGIALFLASDGVKEHIIPYTECVELNCTVTLNIPETMEGTVYIYYALENFYQNHRRYVKSRNDKQYLGNNMREVSDCEPFDYADEAKTIPIAPCGAIANSMFTDSYTIKYNKPNSLPVDLPLTTEGVLWDIDKNKKFKNPEGPDLCQAFAGTQKPPRWTFEPCQIGGFENVDFIVWMRTAALPNFRKLWRIVEKKGEFVNGLPAGEYTITISNTYNVTAFDGKKSIVFSTTSWAGGKNSFLGIAYLVVGCLAIVLAIIFIFIHVKFGHSVAELSNIAPTGN